jgi:hypothetical protein
MARPKFAAQGCAGGGLIRGMVVKLRAAGNPFTEAGGLKGKAVWKCKSKLLTRRVIRGTLAEYAVCLLVPAVTALREYRRHRTGDGTAEERGGRQFHRASTLSRGVSQKVSQPARNDAFDLVLNREWTRMNANQIH